MTISQFSFPTRIQSGPGAVGLVGGALREAGKKRPLIVTDRGLAPLAPVTGNAATSSPPMGSRLRCSPGFGETR